MSAPNTQPASMPPPVINNKTNNKPVVKQRRIATLALTKPGMVFSGIVKNNKGYNVVQFRIIPPEVKKNAKRKRVAPMNLPPRMNIGGNINSDPCKRRLVRQALTMQGVTDVQRMRFLRQIGCNIPRRMHSAGRMS